ncbi:lytic murein transglycosylase [Nocardioides sp. S-58]|uniref:Lytic murein transglycosylase n=1 Tax=Nocardioides renjunii TaxID=3095075 RepID=A0ABU5KEG0_9ACTN|nr:lytic murein transglycosylase [Nocardioides sp. S-58]MDZ5663229.1 lytic murein transglycosylase [Nocardioides sp. S-58]
MSSSAHIRRATAIIPLAVLSAAWTASLAGVGVGSASADPEGSGTLPDGTNLPAAVIEAPASVGDAVTRAAAVTPGSAGDIPQVALAAYQRAEGVINKADPGCRLSWELVAAIGRVESDHGRSGGSSLDESGVARPAIVGIALDGSNDTQAIVDTDGGQYDADTRWDRAVGPMQFIPSTWSVVGVDGDSDGRRAPQDVDDAALSTAVYLCSGEDDLSTEQGQRASVYRYNHSNDYVDLVLSIMQAYLDGDFSAVPTSTLPSGVMVPGTTATTGGTDGGGDGNRGGKGSGTKDDRDGDRPTKNPSPTKGPSPTTTPTPTQTPTQDPTQDPTQNATPSPTQNPTQNPTQSPTQSPTDDPTAVPTQTPTSQPTAVPSTLPPLPTVPVPTLTQTLTWAQAQAQCLASGILAINLNQLNACINNLMNP